MFHTIPLLCERKSSHGLNFILKKGTAVGRRDEDLLKKLRTKIMRWCVLELPAGRLQDQSMDRHEIIAAAGGRFGGLFDGTRTGNRDFDGTFGMHFTAHHAAMEGALAVAGYLLLGRSDERPQGQ